jgi:hypothetical protein
MRIEILDRKQVALALAQSCGEAKTKVTLVLARWVHL